MESSDEEFRGGGAAEPLSQADADQIRAFLREDADRVMGVGSDRKFTPQQREAVPEIISLLQQQKDLDHKIDVLLRTAVAVVVSAVLIFCVVHFGHYFPALFHYLHHIVGGAVAILVAFVSTVWYKHDIFATNAAVKRQLAVQDQAVKKAEAAKEAKGTAYSPVTIAKTNRCRGRALVTETYPGAKLRSLDRA